MRKLAIVAAALLLALAGCGAKTQVPWPISENTRPVCGADSGVTIVLEEGSLTDSGGSFTLQNNSGAEIIGSPYDYLLQIRIGDQWYEIEVYFDVPASALNLSAGETFAFAVDWSPFFGRLPSGRYRLLKEYCTQVESGAQASDTLYAACAFTIS